LSFHRAVVYTGILAVPLVALAFGLFWVFVLPVMLQAPIAYGFAGIAILAIVLAAVVRADRRRRQDEEPTIIGRARSEESIRAEPRSWDS
jgi:hypothetical protein